MGVCACGHVFPIGIGTHGTAANFDTSVVFSAAILTKITPDELGSITEKFLTILQ